MLKAIRKMVFLFIPMLIIFLLLQGIVGQRGYYVNKELEKINKENEELLARLSVKRDALKKYEDSLKSQQALDDIALKLGYNKSGEQVYFFTEQEEMIMDNLSISEIESSQKQLEFKGLPAHLIAIISFFTVFIPYLIVKIVQLFVRRNKKDDFVISRGEYNDYSF